MRASFDVSSSSGKYLVSIDAKLLTGILESNPAAVIVVDQCLLDYLPDNCRQVIQVEATESNKSLAKMSDIILQMREMRTHRKSHMIAIGGGIIQDIATFAASIYMRGISWDYFPTTLLGMVDSCIGGKSSINVGGYKNLVGNFYPPKHIYIDTNFIRTLDTEQRIAGLCEAAKICYARSAKEFDEYLSVKPDATMDEVAYSDIIVRSLMDKRWFIETDEFDQNERLLLNYGHTFGHALEAATDFGIAHGIAVGIGMIVAVKYSESHKLLNPQGEIRSEKLINHVNDLLTYTPSSLDALKNIDLSLVLNKFESDKKHTGECYRFIAPTRDGGLEIMNINKSDKSRDDIYKAFENALTA